MIEEIIEEYAPLSHKIAKGIHGKDYVDIGIERMKDTQE